MGSSSSKFRKHIQSGDEYAALHLYSSSSDLRKALDPNVSYGDSYNHDTPMHVVGRFAMKSLLRIFLFDLGGNPNKKNGRNETVLHSVCAGITNDQSLTQKQRRVECIMLCFQWRGTKLANGTVECIDVKAVDELDNTALHYAAMNGLQQAVELLVAYGAPLFVENAAKETPCDCAEKFGHAEIALYLESKMVFSNEDQNADELGVLLSQLESDEGYSGLRAQDLQEAKDQLLVETSDMLHVPLFTAEALLRNHEWSREMLLEAWIEDPVACCEKCGVVPPGGLQASGQSQLPSEKHSENTTTPYSLSAMAGEQTMCEICACIIAPSEDPVLLSCEHRFCRSCWQIYLTGKITDGETYNITCPGYDCSRLVPVDLIENLVSRDMARRYLQFDIKAFVESNPMIKWCPYPGCGRAVRLPDSDNPMSPLFRTSASVHSPIDTSHAVDCGNGHIFCWECLGEAHEPASCENWNNWHQKIADIKPEELNGTEEETENSANCLWLITNSKACPNCKSPIQKNEGCNHMKCSKCKFDFCWVCLEAWKKHSTATGGYFRCNRYEIVKKVEESHDHLKAEAEQRNEKMQELNRFVHYYSRFRNHENSYKLETALYDTAKEKMLILARAVSDSRESAIHETKFVQDAITQLLKARHVLKCSYVYGYFLEDVGYKKPIFEFMQTELEECTEALSEMIARPYLHTPRTKIVQTAHLVQRKRHELVAAISKGLVPPDTSPATRKKKAYRVDEDTRKALLASLQDDSFNLWVRDVSSGRHPNIPPVLNWPEVSDESDSETSPSHIETAVSVGTAGGNDVIDLSDVNLQIPGFSGLGSCMRNGCHRRRAVNQLTGQVLEYCSIECMRLDRTAAGDTSSDFQRDDPVFGQNANMGELISDYQLDLLRALEMSRLQFLREIGSLRPGNGEGLSPSENSPVPSPSKNVSPSSRTRSRSTNDGGTCDVHHDGRLMTASRLSMDSMGASSTGNVTTSRPSRPNMQPPSVDFIPSQSNADFVGRRTIDQELTRALEISQLNLHGEERDMCLAIALSIQDSVAPQTGPSESQDDQCAGLATSTTTTTTATTTAGASPMFLSRSSSAVVPELQVRCCSEHVVRSYDSPVFMTGGVGVGGPSRLSCNCSSSVCTHTLPCIGPDPTSRRSFCRCGMCSADADSFDCGFPQHVFTRHRLSFTGGETSSDPSVAEMVFEPRPPHPFMLTSTKKSSCADRCGLAHDETVTVLDPWRRRPLSLDHHQHARPQHCIRSSHGVCCSSTKHGSVSKRRRSCGTHPSSRHHDHFATLETGYASDRALSPALSVTDTASSLSSKDPTVAAATAAGEDESFRILPSSNPAKTKQDSIDLIISSDILESMLQGTAGYRVGLMSQGRRSEWTSDGHLASAEAIERSIKMDADVVDQSAAAVGSSSASATASSAPVAAVEADHNIDRQPDDGDAVFV